MLNILETPFVRTFEEGWAAQKFDAKGGYYCTVVQPALAGAHIGAVDVLATSPQRDRLQLIEVKGYSPDPADGREKIRGGKLLENIQNKVAGTLATLQIAYYVSEAALAHFYIQPKGAQSIELFVVIELPDSAQPMERTKALHRTEASNFETALKTAFRRFRISAKVVTLETVKPRDGFSLKHLPTTQV